MLLLFKMSERWYAVLKASSGTSLQQRIFQTNESVVDISNFTSISIFESFFLSPFFRLSRFIVPSLWNHSQLPSLSQAPQLPRVGNGTSSVVRQVSASVVVKVPHVEPGRLTGCQLETEAAIYERFGPHPNITRFIASKDGNNVTCEYYIQDYRQCMYKISTPSSHSSEQPAEP
jgi:hypothetical protein